MDPGSGTGAGTAGVFGVVVGFFAGGAFAAAAFLGTAAAGFFQGWAFEGTAGLGTGAAAGSGGVGTKLDTAAFAELGLVFRSFPALLFLFSAGLRTFLSFLARKPVDVTAPVPVGSRPALRGTRITLDRRISVAPPALPM